MEIKTITKKEIEDILFNINFLIEQEEKKIKKEGLNDWYRLGVVDGLNISRTMIKERLGDKDDK